MGWGSPAHVFLKEVSDMSFTFDTTTNIGKVRTLINDKDSTSFVLTDEEINVFLSLESNDIYNSAAAALEAIIINKQLLSKMIAAGDYKEDTRNVADKLGKTAERYRKAAISRPADAFAEVAVSDFNYREIETNKALRNELD